VLGSSLLACALFCALLPSDARAGGFYLLPRGVRGVAQGGAVVAGSDDPGALWYNPAGLVYAGKQLLTDFLLPIQTIDFTRVNSGGEVEPTVSSTSTPLPIPGFGFSTDFGTKMFAMGVGVMAPTAALNNWPRYITDANGERIGAPQRYSLVSMKGSGFGNLSLALAYRPIKYLSFGLQANAVVGRFVVDVAMSLCDQALLCSFPEDGDADATISVPSEGFPFIVRPGGAAGLVIDLADLAPVRIGLSVTSTFKLAGEAKLDVRIPQEGAYEGATLSNDRADFEVKFPWIVRAGVEVRPIDTLRLEAQLTWEGWSIQERMKVRPKNVVLSALDGGFTYELGSLDMPRGMRDVWAVGLGSEYDLNDAWQLRTGFMYERGSLPDQYFQLVTPDTDKYLVGLGATVDVSGLTQKLGLGGRFLVDITGGHVFMPNKNIECTKVFQPYPLRPGLPEPSCAEQKAVNSGMADRGTTQVPLANGRYDIEASFVGLGFRWKFDEPDEQLPPG
jgi:long-chain fatty acid transport protein